MKKVKKGLALGLLTGLEGNFLSLSVINLLRGVLNLSPAMAIQTDKAYRMVTKKPKSSESLLKVVLQLGNIPNIIEVCSFVLEIEVAVVKLNDYLKFLLSYFICLILVDIIVFFKIVFVK